MEGLTAALTSELTLGGLLGLVVLFFMLGWIRPKSAVTELREDRDKRLDEMRAERDDWREAHRASEAVRETQRQTVREALEVARLAEDALRGIRTAAAYAENDARENGREEAS